MFLKQTISIIVCLVIYLVPFDSSFVQAEQDNKTVLEAIENEKKETQQPDPATEQNGSVNEEQIADEFVVENQSLFFVLIQMLGALIVVIGLIYFLLRFVNKKTQSFRSHQTIQNIGGVGLGANRSVQLIKVGDRLLVVGVGDSIQLIKEIDSDDEVKKIIDQQNSQSDQLEQSFSSIGQWVKKRVIQDDQTMNPKQIRFGELLENKLKDVKKTKKDAYEVIKEKENE
ncbi:flagellar biosynthetic protein FliO [Anaerobacillus sp. MEB173]|uniref:flagellar biosynthetic protein FliO n=1 Tax=Anaerobacillus sp. MEB173 TaxID=3383345 RepID=UPI003F90140A